MHRRHALKSLAATVALPFLPSLAWAAGNPANAQTPPRRWGLFLFANGVNADHWQAQGSGSAIELSKTLKPLENIKQELLFIDGLRLFDDTVGVHTPYFTNFLSCVPIKPGPVPNLAPSLDQIMARSIGVDSPVPSLVVGTEPPDFGLSAGSPAIYGTTMSWSSPTTPVGPTIHPAQVYDRLFDVKGLERDRSVWDLVLAQAKDLRGNLGLQDQRKLDEYQDSVREIEKRIARATSTEPRSGWQPSLDKPNLERPDTGNLVYKDRVKLMLDLIVLAFQMDKTRLVTFLFQKDITGMTFEWLNGVSRTGMHTISHHNRKPDMLKEYQLINQWHVEQFAYLCEKMRAIDEGGTTLLDNSMLLFGSTMRDGDFHDANNLPLVLAGRGGGTIKPGRCLNFDTLPERRLANLHLALMRRMGMKIDTFANASGELDGLT